MSTDTQTSPPALPKYSRYRSVRQAAAIQSAPSSSSPENESQPQNVALKKSMSRYRRSREQSNSHKLSGAPPTPMIPQQYPPPIEATRNGNDVQAQHVSQEQYTQPKPQPTEYPRRGRQDHDNNRHDSKDMRQEDIQQYNKHTHRMEEEDALQMLEEQKRKDLERLDAELAAAVTTKRASMGPLSPRNTSPAKEKFTLFSRKRAGSRASPPKTPVVDAPVIVKSNESSLPIGAAPGADAPMSAVNAGERVRNTKIICLYGY
jgi:hypothetical protein